MSPDDELIEQLRRTVASCGGDRIRRIILYGSRAARAADGDSDFDLLVVEGGGPVAAREERVRYCEALRGFPHPVDVWVMDEEEFEETKDVVGGLAYPANKYGVVLQ